MIRYNPKGLTTPQIDESRRRHGDNVITPPKDDSAWRLLLEKFRDPIIRILLLAAVLSLIIGFVHKDFTESVGIICAIVGIVLAVVAKKQNPSGLATAGLVLSIIALAICIISIIAVIACAGALLGTLGSM